LSRTSGTESGRMRTLEQLDFEGKRVLGRVDFNVPLG
jgi:3-phosphoglycerate kinase